MPERSANISTHDPFGSLLGYAPGWLLQFIHPIIIQPMRKSIPMMPPFAVI